MPFKAVTFDAYGTLLRNEHLRLIPERIVADHALTVSIDEVFDAWLDLYGEAIQRPTFQTLRVIQGDVLTRLLRRFAVNADARPYVDLFFTLTTTVELYADARAALAALGPLRSAIISNADHEHAAAWDVLRPIEFIVISEAVRAYKPHPAIFRAALERLRLPPDDVLHVGDSELDDVAGAKAAGLRVAWVNRDGRARRLGVARADFEVNDLEQLAALL